MPNTPIANMSAAVFESLEKRILETMPTWDNLFGFKTVRPERLSKTAKFKRFSQPIFNRVIDLSTFYTVVTGKRPAKLYVGYEEMRQIMMEQQACDMVGFHHKNGMLGMLDGMAVFQKRAKHHLECV